MDIDKICINDVYCLRLLKKIEDCNITEVLDKGMGVYICSLPDQGWHNLHEIKPLRNYSIEKKRKMFNSMPNGSLLLSPTQVENHGNRPIGYRNGKIIHLGANYESKRLQQLSYFGKILKILIKERENFSYVLFYNVEFPIFGLAMIVKLLRKKVYLELEDDYTTIRGGYVVNLLTKLFYSIVDLAICVNRNMIKHFSGVDKIVFNGFIDLEYVDSLNEFCFGDKVKFLFSGSLDEIRGIQLLSVVVPALKSRFGEIEVIICGFGPLAPMIEKLGLDEVKFYGFVSDEKLKLLMESANIFLVLQIPDHPFSLGSFPSKIESYAEYRKPILRLETY